MERNEGVVISLALRETGIKRKLIATSWLKRINVGLKSSLSCKPTNQATVNQVRTHNQWPVTNRLVQ